MIYFSPTTWPLWRPSIGKNTLGVAYILGGFVPCVPSVNLFHSHLKSHNQSYFICLYSSSSTKSWRAVPIWTGFLLEFSVIIAAWFHHLARGSCITNAKVMILYLTIVLVVVVLNSQHYPPIKWIKTVFRKGWRLSPHH